MTPEPYPTTWRWIDLRLPSGTLWLDRNVGAASPEDAGLYFSWGQKFGHRVGEYSFNSTRYNQEGLAAISSDLTAENDGARIYYGDHYRMPDLTQIEELIQNTTAVINENYIDLVSNANGNSIRIPNSGYADISHIEIPQSRRFACRKYLNASTCYSYLHDDEQGQLIVTTIQRSRGLPIRPVYHR